MSTVKESFIEYLKTKSKPNSRKPTSYAKAMEILEDVLFTKKFSQNISIWNFINSNNIDEIYHFVKEQQKSDDGIFKEYTPSSYWKDGYCSAALKEFGEFIGNESRQSKKIVQRSQINPSSINIPKSFILLAGISGTGKTRFVREQAKAFDSETNNYCLVPVRPDWHEPSDLLGFTSRLSGKPEFVSTKTLNFIINAWQAIAPYANKNGHGELDLSVPPYWLCLDEMNLAPVEQYFADYLSVLESRIYEDGHYTCEALLDKSLLFDLKQQGADVQKDLRLSDADDLWQYFLNHGISIPPNLIVAGTVNMDETTHGFSRKVIDRALTIDFGDFFPNDYQHFFDSPVKPKIFSYSLLTQANQEDLSATYDSDGSKSIIFLTEVNNVLNRTPFELAYRALNELLLQVACFNPKSEAELQAIWDDFLMLKILPRIDGDEDKLRLTAGDSETNVLLALTALLKQQLDKIWESGRRDYFRENNDGSDMNDILCRTKEKLKWMEDRLETSTFTSFWP